MNVSVSAHGAVVVKEVLCEFYNLIIFFWAPWISCVLSLFISHRDFPANKPGVPAKESKPSANDAQRSTASRPDTAHASKAPTPASSNLKSRPSIASDLTPTASATPKPLAKSQSGGAAPSLNANKDVRRSSQATPSPPKTAAKSTGVTTSSEKPPNAQSTTSHSLSTVSKPNPNALSNTKSLSSKLSSKNGKDSKSGKSSSVEKSSAAAQLSRDNEGSRTENKENSLKQGSDNKLSVNAAKKRPQTHSKSPTGQSASQQIKKRRYSLSNSPHSSASSMPGGPPVDKAKKAATGQNHKVDKPIDEDEKTQKMENAVDKHDKEDSTKPSANAQRRRRSRSSDAKQRKRSRSRSEESPSKKRPRRTHSRSRSNEVRKAFRHCFYV